MIRIGQGFDIHRLTLSASSEGIVLGGVKIPFEKKMVAHSDGDVLIHAIIDAILGACSLGDIGRHFPDTSPEFKDCDSRILLREVVNKMQLKSFSIVNVDATIIAEKPKLSPHIPFMQEILCKDLKIGPDQINIKAKTHEGLDSLGQKEAIASHAVILLTKQVDNENFTE